ncbi:MAG: glycosylasparaginase [Bacteroidetes bacterium]|nr:MAG: glycosylasparaginase [Bacteroidota bacterium]
MTSRRNFLKLGAWSTLLSGTFLKACAQPAPAAPVRPIVVSTWKHGLPANDAAWEVLSHGGHALDAVEFGVRLTEADPKVNTVGYGGFPDREGHVTLDACIMNEQGDCGSVAFLEGIKHPISVARKVMEETPHIMLVGQGAKEFALAQGFKEENLLTPEAEAAWKAWLAKNEAPGKQEINAENHDTISMLAIDREGRMCGACTTSGAAWKLHGRVGDSPIIGAGLYVDNEVGGACATGWGEAVIRICGSHLVVELMRQGHAPAEACRLAVERLVSRNPDYAEIQVGFLALNKQGQYGAYCLQPGFDFALCDASGNRMIQAASKL